MTTAPPNGAEPPAADDEHALRLVLDVWLKDGELTSAAFQTRGPNSPRYVPVSLFVEERLPDGDGARLHTGRFASHGRARLRVGHIRTVSYMAGDGERHPGFDLLMTGTAEPPLEDFGKAHADLQGPTHRPPAARALAVAFNERGQIEKAPEPSAADSA